MPLQYTLGGALLMTAGGALADECCCGGPPPDECTWYLSPDALIFDCNAQSGSFNINVPTGTNCGWEASVTSGGAYLTITAGSTGNTDGTVDFDILGNPDPQRTATITVVTTVVSPLGPIGTVIGTFTMTQESCEDAPFPPGGGGGSPPAPGSTCSWSVGPTNFLLTCFPQGAFFNVNTQLGCDWEAVIISGGSFITITSGTPGGDAGSVFFTVSANAGVARGGQIEVRTLVVSSYGPIGTVVGLVNIAQLTCPGGGGGAPCSWSFGPFHNVANPCDGETAQAFVVTYAGCGWEAISQAPWLTITSGSTGLSSGTVTYDIDANTDGLERVGQINLYSTTASVLGPAGTPIGYVKVKEPDCASVLIEPAMRASNERRARTNLAGATYPNRRFDENGLIAGPGEAPPTEAGGTFYVGNGNTYSMPPDYFYYYDLLNYDAFFGDPAGTRAAQLVNTIRTNINDNGLLNLYVDQAFPIQGAAAITVYNTVSLPVPAVATTVDYEDRLIDLRDAIRLLEFVNTTTVQSVDATSIRKVQSLDPSAAASISCADTNFLTAGTQPYNKQFNPGCVAAGDIGNDFVISGGFLADCVAAGDARVTAGNKLFTYTGNSSPYVTIVSLNIYGFFVVTFYTNAGTANTFVPPAAFGTPAQNTYSLVNSGLDIFTISQADLDSNQSSIIGGLTATGQCRGWVMSSANLIIELGFNTII